MKRLMIYVGDKKMTENLLEVVNKSTQGTIILDLESFDKSTNQIKRFTTKGLLETEFPEPNWAIPNLIPEGLTILGGRPKIGKSWLLMQIAHAVGTGAEFFNRDVQAGNVLYIALEDSGSRLKERAIKQGIPSNANIEWVLEWPAMQNEGIDQLQLEIQTQKFNTIVIDTLTRGLPGVNPTRNLPTIQRVYGDLQTIALENNADIITSDHTRKPFGLNRDPIDDIIDSTSKTAIADATFALYRQGNKQEANLLGRGRDFEDVDLMLDWDYESFSWHSLGDSDEVLTNQSEIKVFTAIEELIELGILPTTTKIADLTGMAKANVSRTIGKLIGDQKIIRGDKQGREQPYYPNKYYQSDNDDNNDKHGTM